MKFKLGTSLKQDETFKIGEALCEVDIMEDADAVRLARVLGGSCYDLSLMKGRVRTKVVPLLGLESQVSVPPCFSVIT